MTSEIRSTAPAGWILLPVLLASGMSALAAWATDLLALITRSGDEVAAAKDATDRTVDDLARTVRTVRSLAAAAERIGMVVKLIQSKAMTNDSMEATWIGFRLWTEAVEAAGATEIDKVRAALGGRQIAAPSGFTLKMDGKTHHLYKPAMIGRISKDGLILPVWATEGLVPREPWSPWLAPGRSNGAVKAA
jgi:ABC-type branched-subunit amino acid transport system substrate-binding protein